METQAELIEFKEDKSVYLDGNFSIEELGLIIETAKEKATPKSR
jgi:hypothetical protein